MHAAAVELPGAGYSVAAVDHGGLALRTGTPGQHGIGRAEKAPGDLRPQKCRRHGTAGALAQAPGRTRIRARDDLQDFRMRAQIEFRTAK